MAVASPCVRVCAIDVDTGLCIGCGRTRDEISSWPALTDPERLAVLRAVVGRLRESSGAVDVMDCAACGLCAGRHG
ncbi:DUF1289 domain-containing protein [Alsobacter sp. SYSU M60028]|uniref:DUF1289 domain-containing protein n=1 Tax=Alsobacter ponti TaxID=2962936 RepID=A0ABT1L992_9HYPH|nr:DUF1289 domain-containing protein [Alsobacter ponti]MCP8938057.1 DUF1289 domain-containing protein [Alsobacter ponti]